MDPGLSYLQTADPLYNKERQRSGAIAIYASRKLWFGQPDACTGRLTPLGEAQQRYTTKFLKGEAMKIRHFLLVSVLLAVPVGSQAQNTFPSSGPVGIGTNAPSTPLHIAASSGGRSGVTLAQLEFKGIAQWFINLGTTDSSQSVFYLSTGTSVPFSLTQGGEMTLNSLRGSGTRMLVASPDGVIRTQSLPGGSGSGDNLGNHTATANLNMQARDIVNVRRIKFDGQSSPEQTSASPWIYHNLPEGFRAEYRFLIGIGNIDPSYKLKVEGDAYATGVWIASDADMKSNMAKLRDPLNAVLKMRGVAYDIKPDPTSPPYRTVGLIAQEVKEIFPEAVRRNPDGQMSVNYNATVALLIEAVKQQQVTIRTQQRRIEQLERRIEKVEATPQ